VATCAQGSYKDNVCRALSPKHQHTVSPRFVLALVLRGERWWGWKNGSGKLSIRGRKVRSCRSVGESQVTQGSNLVESMKDESG
jgi:hypothetical protein